MKTIKVGNGQQVEDVAIAEYGDAASCVLVCADNGLGLDDLLFPGQELLIRTPVPEVTENNIQLQQLIAREGISPNSGVSGTAPLLGYAMEDYFAEDYNEN
jgi:hypothetical protein